jgi:hypothetical protein
MNLDNVRFLQRNRETSWRLPGVFGLATVAALAIAGCAAATPTVIVDPMPPGGAWQDVSLIVTGPKANDKKREICMSEARSAGVRLREGAPLSITLYLDGDNNRVQFRDGRPDMMLGQWTIQAVCRVAIAGAINLDDRVKTALNNSDLSSCRQVGVVRGDDQGAIIPFSPRPVLASQEAAMASMKLAALRMKANYVAIEPLSNMMMAVGSRLSATVAGRAYECALAPPPTADKGQPATGKEI